MNIVISEYDVITPYGLGTDVLWQGLLSGKTGIARCNRFSTDAFVTCNAGVIPSLRANNDESLVIQMFSQLFSRNGFHVPADAYLIVASTTGEIDLLERAVLDGRGDAGDSILAGLAPKVERLAGLKRSGMIVSSACASATVAFARALSLIRSGAEDCVLVAAADCVSEFVFSGFSSLMALDENCARPFDKYRNGLTVGESAGYMLLMSETRAREKGHKICGRLVGAGLSNDANHMTGPSRDGSGLARAMKKSLLSAGIDKESIGYIAAHGTGTQYNDAMEMKAFKSVFERPRPIFSVKGGTGHTMGSTGLVQCAAALHALTRGTIPPTVGLRDVSDEASGWAKATRQDIDKPYGMVVNAGFGGINAAVVIEK